MSPKHRGWPARLQAWHFILAVMGEYGPRIQMHLIAPLLGHWVSKLER